MSPWLILVIIAATAGTGILAALAERHPGGRIARLLALHDHAEDQGHQCDRCRTGDIGLPCACDTDCYAPACYGWVDDEWRDMIRGDA